MSRSYGGPVGQSKNDRAVVTIPGFCTLMTGITKHGLCCMPTDLTEQAEAASQTDTFANDGPQASLFQGS